MDQDFASDSEVMHITTTICHKDLGDLEDTMNEFQSSA